MFLHNIKYTIKCLFKNKVLIFWTFAFPIILGIFFNMAFSSIEEDELLKVSNIAIIDNEEYNNNDIYKETFDYLSNESNDDRLFNITYTSIGNANDLLESKEIIGYLILEDDKPNLVFNTTGTYQTILKFVVDEIETNKSIVTNITTQKVIANEKQNLNYNVEEIAMQVLDRINNEKITYKNKSNENMSYMMIEYYTLIAMACMYGGMIGLTAINQCLANMSNKGKRISVSPTNKLLIVLSSLIGSYIVSLTGIALLFLFLLFGLKIDFGSQLDKVILLSMVGSLAGISLGILISSFFRVSEGAKTGIIIAVTMFLSVLSGMMGVVLKYKIDTYAPIVNRLNPNNLITDGFYSLYYYNTLDRFYSDLIGLLIFIGICLLLSFISLRREQYDSI